MQPEFLLTRSSYYDQYLNTAIFFEPFRIYFNNGQESLALEAYYKLQNAFPSPKEGFANVFILIYGDETKFEKSFGQCSEPLMIVQEGADYIVGVRANKMEQAYQDLEKFISGL